MVTAPADRVPSGVDGGDRGDQTAGLAGTSGPRHRDRLDRFLPWLVGLALSVVVLGPALGPGPIFNLDLALADDIPVPRGAWGLGPELPRRVPLWTFAAWISPVFGGANVGKFLMVASIVVAFVGAYRLAAGHGRFVGYVAGLLYAVGPFMLTRLAVGHLMVALPMAVLPWVLPRLLRPADDLWATFLSVLALSLAGHYGGTIACIVVLVGLCAERGRNLLRVVGVTAVAQLPWLVPGIVVYLQGASIVDAAPFSTYADSFGDYLRILAGHGFWQSSYQVGWPGGTPVMIAGVVLTALAIVGTHDLPTLIARRMAVLAGVGFFLAVANVLPGMSGPYVWLSRTAVGSVLREGQRVLPLFLVWMAPAAALGAQRLGRRLFDPASNAATTGPPRSALRAAAGSVVQAVPLALALLLAFPGVWGPANGDARGPSTMSPLLRPVDLPPEWEKARAVINAEPGPVLALPWHQYFDLQVDGDRQVLDPLPLFLGGDVITSSDPELDQADRKERVDPREQRIDEILRAARKGDPISDQLAHTGVRWVVLLHEVDWLNFGAFGADKGLVPKVHGPALDVYEVKGWGGLVVDANGHEVPSNPIVEPLLQLDASGPATYQRPGSAGWMRGLSPAGVTADGTIALPEGSGPVWYWPSLVVLAADLITAVFVVVAVRATRRRRRDIGQKAQTEPDLAPLG